jgi:hypothetical protein
MIDRLRKKEQVVIEVTHLFKTVLVFSAKILLGEAQMIIGFL